MLKAAIFDMDGVIIDSEPMYHELKIELFKELNITADEKEMYSYTGLSPSHMWGMVKEKYGLSHILEELVEMYTEGFLNKLLSSKNIMPINGILELLKDFSANNIKIGVASSSPIHVIKKTISALKLDEFFDILVSGDEVEKGKPEPDIFLRAANILEASPHECIVVEDSRNGVIAANKAKIKCIGYKNPNSGNQDISTADLIITSYSEISHEKLKNLWSFMDTKL